MRVLDGNRYLNRTDWRHHCCTDVTFYLFSSLALFGFLSAELQSNTNASLQEKDFVNVPLLQPKLKGETTFISFLEKRAFPVCPGITVKRDG